MVQPRPQGFSLKKWVGRTRPTHFVVHGLERAEACGIFSDYLCFWRGICGILRQLSRRVRFRFVMQSFFSDSLYS